MGTLARAATVTYANAMNSCGVQHKEVFMSRDGVGTGRACVIQLDDQPDILQIAFLEINAIPFLLRSKL